MIKKIKILNFKIYFLLYLFLAFSNFFIAECAGNDSSNDTSLVGLGIYTTVSVGFILIRLAYKYYYPDVPSEPIIALVSEDNHIIFDDALINMVLVELPTYYNETIMIASLGLVDAIGIMFDIPPLSVLGFLIYWCILSIGPDLALHYFGVHITIDPDDLADAVVFFMHLLDP